MSTLRDVLDTKRSLVHSVSPDATIHEAVDAMCFHHVGALLVRTGEAVVGVFSERDVMTRVVLARKDPATTVVRDVMTTNVVCIDLNAEPEEAMRIMTEKRCRHLPVVAGGNVIAVVSIGDLVRWVSRHQEFELQTLREYIQGSSPPPAYVFTQAGGTSSMQE